MAALLPSNMLETSLALFLQEDRSLLMLVHFVPCKSLTEIINSSWGGPVVNLS